MLVPCRARCPMCRAVLHRSDGGRRRSACLRPSRQTWASAGGGPSPRSSSSGAWMYGRMCVLDHGGEGHTTGWGHHEGGHVCMSAGRSNLLLLPTQRAGMTFTATCLVARLRLRLPSRRCAVHCTHMSSLGRRHRTIYCSTAHMVAWGSEIIVPTAQATICVCMQMLRWDLPASAWSSSSPAPPLPSLHHSSHLSHGYP